MIRHLVSRAGRGMRLWAYVVTVSLTTVLALFAGPVSSAFGAFGDGYGPAPINGTEGAPDVVPALPDAERAFWAGNCDRATVPEFGGPVPEGGIGTRPSTFVAPFFNRDLDPARSDYETRQSPAVAPHCLDWGTMAGQLGTFSD